MVTNRFDPLGEDPEDTFESMAWRMRRASDQQLEDVMAKVDVWYKELIGFENFDPEVMAKNHDRLLAKLLGEEIESEPYDPDSDPFNNINDGAKLAFLSFAIAIQEELWRRRRMFEELEAGLTGGDE